jgi:hypothetical protein
MCFACLPRLLLACHLKQFPVAQYMALADKLIQLADKEELGECARLLAMNVAHYEMKYGKLPLQDRLAMTYANEINDPQAELVVNGMETLVGILGSVIQGLDEKSEH